jgi:hypothetical protein
MCVVKSNCHASAPQIYTHIAHPSQVLLSSYSQHVRPDCHINATWCVCSTQFRFKTQNIQIPTAISTLYDAWYCVILHQGFSPLASPSVSSQRLACLLWHADPLLCKHAVSPATREHAIKEVTFSVLSVSGLYNEAGSNTSTVALTAVGGD